MLSGNLSGMLAATVLSAVPSQFTPAVGFASMTTSSNGGGCSRSRAIPSNTAAEPAIATR
jgi:hypothetical protein